MTKKTISLLGLLVFIFFLLLTIVSIYYNSIPFNFTIDMGDYISGLFGMFVSLIIGGIIFLSMIKEDDLCLVLIVLFWNIIIFLFSLLGTGIGGNSLLNYQVQNNKPYLLTQCGLNPKHINQVRQDDKKEGLLSKKVYIKCLEKLDNERSAIQPNVKGKYIAMFNSKGSGNFTKDFINIKELDKYVFYNTSEILNKKEEQNKLIEEKAEKNAEEMVNG